ncbi:hypothetical protein [Streptomyces sp. NPDC088789]|uniref:hypothetical protein n=1 Tax=Streptomyces sp. NPDC088789 TaxID=3365899 RepID=UPI003813629E
MSWPFPPPAAALMLSAIRSTVDSFWSSSTPIRTTTSCSLLPGEGKARDSTMPSAPLLVTAFQRTL